jgi:hypothetical protein
LLEFGTSIAGGLMLGQGLAADYFGNGDMFEGNNLDEKNN